MDSKVVVLDNGGGTCKAGFAGEEEPRRCFPNCTAKGKGDRVTLVGDMLHDCKDITGLSLRRPFDRGYLLNLDLQREIWHRTFKSTLRIAPSEACLLMTEPMFNFPQLQAATAQMVFEDFGFKAFFAAPAPLFALQHHASLRPDTPASQARCGVVVDLGFSFSHIVPIFDGRPLLGGVRRVGLGGKALTNYFKELVTYRSLNMMEEPYLMELIKEQLCFVSADLAADMAAARLAAASPHRREFVLPDGVNSLRGYVRTEQQVEEARERERAARRGGGGHDLEQALVLNNERFCVPEALFRPAEIGLPQAGVTEALAMALAALPAPLRPLLSSNVVLAGGGAACPGMMTRFAAEARPMLDADWDVQFYLDEAPELSAWRGASLFGDSDEYWHAAMTKAQYEESGGLRRDR